MKKTVFALAVLLTSPGLTSASGPAQANPAGCEPSQNELLAKTSKEFLNAAKKIVGESASSEAAALLKLAEASADESERLSANGDFENARKMLTDSTQSAIHAIIVSRNSDAGFRNRIISEDTVLRERHEKERAKTMFEKSAPEVDIFIKTAERLLRNNGSPDAVTKLEDAKRLYRSSMDKASVDDYDGALEGMNQAYKMATGTVKSIKLAQGDIITFPKAASADEKDILLYELKKNEAYISFASNIAEGSGEAKVNSLIFEALDARDAAKNAIAAGEKQRAIENLRKSTGLFIKAIKTSGN